MQLVICGEYNPDAETHQATNAALTHSLNSIGRTAHVEWVSSAELSPTFLEDADGLLIAPGPPHKAPLKTLEAITFGRNNKTPVFGTCGGFQLMVVELARNVAGIADAEHAEYQPDAASPVVAPLSCSLRGMELELSVEAASIAGSLYGTNQVVERYYCSFGINPKYRERILAGGVRAVGEDRHGEVRIVELANHPFFVASLFVPQARSTPEQPHPLVTGFLRACFEHSQSRRS